MQHDFCARKGAFGVRQLAAAFESNPMARFSRVCLKAAASCRTPKASPSKNYASFGVGAGPKIKNLLRS